MESEALKTLSEEGMQAADVVLSYAVDLKYVGQFHEVTIAFASLSESFAELQEALRGTTPKAVRLQSSRPASRGASLAPYGHRTHGKAIRCWRIAAKFTGKVRPQRTREVIFEGHKMLTDVYEGRELSAASALEGPAIIEEPTTTVVIPPGCSLVVNQFGDYELSLGESAINGSRKNSSIDQSGVEGSR